MTSKSELPPLIDDFHGQFECYLRNYLTTKTWAFSKIGSTAEYAVIAGGKRLRPLLLCATLSSLSGPCDLAFPAAVAIELLHAFSLVHDDLPEMDNADLRRGKLTVHRKFGAASAVLLGDLLQGCAFEVLAYSPLYEANIKVKLLQLLADVVSGHGLIAGQWAEFNLAEPTPADVKHVQYLKTAMLFETSAHMAAVVAECNAERYQLVTEVGRMIGVLYQLLDDFADFDEDSDASQEQWNLVFHLGHQRAATQISNGLVTLTQNIEKLPNPAPLLAFVEVFQSYYAELKVRL